MQETHIPMDHVCRKTHISGKHISQHDDTSWHGSKGFNFWCSKGWLHAQVASGLAIDSYRNVDIPVCSVKTSYKLHLWQSIIRHTVITAQGRYRLQTLFARGAYTASDNALFFATHTNLIQKTRQTLHHKLISYHAVGLLNRWRLELSSRVSVTRVRLPIWLSLRPASLSWLVEP